MTHKIGARMAQEEDKEHLVSQDSFRTVKTIEPAEKGSTESTINPAFRPRAFKNFG